MPDPLKIVKGARVLCLKTHKSDMYPDQDFGVKDQEYTITQVLGRTRFRIDVPCLSFFKNRNAPGVVVTSNRFRVIPKLRKTE